MLAARPELKGILYGSLGALFTGFYIVFFKLARGGLEPQQIVLLLFVFSSLFQLPFAALTAKSLRLARPSSKELLCAGIMAIGAIFGNLTSAIALTSMSAPLVTAFVRFEVIFVGLASYILMQEKLSAWFF